ncbi:hypothetical protein ACFL59_03090 [Planctomycetota bacterium]
MAQWVYDPHVGGTRIPETARNRIRERILAHAAGQYAEQYTRIDVRFRGKLCYIDAYREPYLSRGFPPPGHDETREEALERLRQTPIHLCRLRHFGGDDRWSLALYMCGPKRYEPCLFESGRDFGTVEEALDLAAAFFLND